MTGKQLLIAATSAAGCTLGLGTDAMASSTLIYTQGQDGDFSVTDDPSTWGGPGQYVSNTGPYIETGARADEDGAGTASTWVEDPANQDPDHLGTSYEVFGARTATHLYLGGIVDNPDSQPAGGGWWRRESLEFNIYGNLAVEDPAFDQPTYNDHQTEGFFKGALRRFPWVGRIG